MVVFGYSDDNVELRGYLDEEIGSYEGTTIYLDKDGIFDIDCDMCASDDCKLFRQHMGRCKSIEAVWDADGYSWVYKTDIPHETFDIYDDGEKCCRGIVFKWPWADEKGE